MKSTKISNKFLAYLIPLILVAGTALGVSVWLMNAEVPIEYDEPYTISMSQNETVDYNWQELPFRDTTTTEKADFGETGSGISYHQYVKVDNPADTDPVNVSFEVNEPDQFTDNMGFSILDGIVEPGEEGELRVEEWGSIQDNIVVDPGNTENVTVVYTLDGDVETGEDYDVTWNFSEIDEN